LDCPEAELSILVVDDREIEKINYTYLNRRGPTNVIAFPMREGQFSDITPHLLGDVVISAETAYRESRESGMSLQKRFNQLMVHGILHLLGFDHEKTEDEAKLMEEKNNQLLQIINV
jgi:probable rRNA maturation factor